MPDEGTGGVTLGDEIGERAVEHAASFFFFFL